MAKKKKNGNDLITFNGLNEFYQGMIKPEFDKISKNFSKLTQYIVKLNQKMDAGFAQAKQEREEMRTELKNEIRFVKDDVKGLHAEISDAASKREVNQLKTQMRMLQN